MRTGSRVLWLSGAIQRGSEAVWTQIRLGNGLERPVLEAKAWFSPQVMSVEQCSLKPPGWFGGSSDSSGVCMDFQGLQLELGAFCA